MTLPILIQKRYSNHSYNFWRPGNFYKAFFFISGCHLSFAEAQVTRPTVLLVLLVFPDNVVMESTGLRPSTGRCSPLLGSHWLRNMDSLNGLKYIVASKSVLAISVFISSYTLKLIFPWKTSPVSMFSFLPMTFMFLLTRTELILFHIQITNTCQFVFPTYLTFSILLPVPIQDLTSHLR